MGQDEILKRFLTIGFLVGLMLCSGITFAQQKKGFPMNLKNNISHENRN